MVNRGQQLRMKRLVERLFIESCSKPVAGIENELQKLGFTQTGGDLRALQFGHREFELFLELMLDENQCVHSYRILTFVERDKPQPKFRW